MAFVSHGYGDSEIREAQWARLAPLLGSPYAYNHHGALSPFIAGGRTVGFVDGATAGYGVLVESTGTSTIDLPAGAAWWTVCLRRKWGNRGRVSELVALQSAGMGVPSARESRPGDIDDQPLAFVQTTSTGITTLVDARQHVAPLVSVADIRAVHNPILGATYTTSSGDQWIGELSSAGTVTLARKADRQPQLPDVPRIRFDTVRSIYFDSVGGATLRHNLGYRPRWFTFDWEANAQTRPLVIKQAYPAQYPDAITETTVRVFAKLADAPSPNTPYTGNLAALNWTAYGGF